MLEVCETAESVRRFVRSVRQRGISVGFVPTMGYLHDGHLSLIRRAQSSADSVVASIFVNPCQFNNKEDFERYPIDIPRDLKLLESCGTAAVFMPNAQEIYGKNHQSWVTVESLSIPHEGEFRAGHFRGVATVVCVLLNIVQPDTAVFGEKDFQQLRIIEQMVSDLAMPVKIIRGVLVREADGLALSSRNVRLSATGRSKALKISAGLNSACAAFRQGERAARKLESLAGAQLMSERDIRVEYVRLINESDLAVLETAVQGSRIIVAAWIDGVRLIDNIELSA